MSLSEATAPTGERVGPEGPGPWPTTALAGLASISFGLPCGDPWISRDGAPGHAYLEGATSAWREVPEWMDYLDPAAPNHVHKLLERDLYLRWWAEALGAKRVLDVGCGIGRFTTAFLDSGADVWGVDADLESLRRCLKHAIGRPGRLDLAWSTAWNLPEVEVDVAVACELLCYVPDAEGTLRSIADRVRSGGQLLLSVEARWGWATAMDAAPGTVQEALSPTGFVSVPADRWVRTYEEADLRALIEGAGLQVRELTATHYGLDGPLERVLPEALDLERLLAIDEAARKHPVWSPLNRAWTATAVKP
jgi:2-polyprenyl-3-methyl-5-hydroxy-6-metoxy-1,4-benzoquinol methylase